MIGTDFLARIEVWFNLVGVAEQPSERCEKEKKKSKCQIFKGTGDKGTKSKDEIDMII